MKANIKIDKEKIRAFYHKIFQNRGLFFVIFWGIVSIYSFNIIYKKAYIEITFVEYPVYDGFLNINKETVTLRKITDNIDAREDVFENAKNQEYEDPFTFREANKKEDINDNHQLTPEDEASVRAED